MACMALCGREAAERHLRHDRVRSDHAVSGAQSDHWALAHFRNTTNMAGKLSLWLMTKRGLNGLCVFLLPSDTAKLSDSKSPRRGLLLLTYFFNPLFTDGWPIPFGPMQYLLQSQITVSCGVTVDIYIYICTGLLGSVVERGSLRPFQLVYV